MWFEYIFTRLIKTIMILWSCTCFCVVSKLINVHHHEFKVQKCFVALEVKFKLVLNTNDSFLTLSTAVISVTLRSCTDTMYVLSALDKSIHHMSKCWQQKLLSEYLRGALWSVFEYLCGKISRQNASYKQGFQLGVCLAFSAMLEMPAYARLLSLCTYVCNSSISQRSFLGPAALPLILFSQETEILLLSGISN